MADDLAFVLPPGFVAALAREVAEILLTQGIVVRAVRSPYLTPLEAADLLRCDRRRIYRMVHDGRIVGVKDGSRLLIERASVEAYLRRE